MLLQKVQINLQALIVIDYAYPDANMFDRAMESEYNEQIEASLESGSTFSNVSHVQQDDDDKLDQCSKNAWN